MPPSSEASLNLKYDIDLCVLIFFCVWKSLFVLLVSSRKIHTTIPKHPSVVCFSSLSLSIPRSNNSSYRHHWWTKFAQSSQQTCHHAHNTSRGNTHHSLSTKFQYSFPSSSHHELHVVVLGAGECSLARESHIYLTDCSSIGGVGKSCLTGTFVVE